jgi:putative mRNA 3-end processing factor
VNGRGGDLLTMTEDGLFCPSGGFHIDPWRPVRRAVVTHAHGDHARPGNREYWCAAAGLGVLSRRVRFGGPEQDAESNGESRASADEASAAIHPVAYGVPFSMADARVSFHPAGHILGSAQVRVESEDQVWVVTGDYKRQPDPTCAAFEPVHCDVLVTEATFALPIYRWREPLDAVREIWEWWMENAAAGRASVLFCYALGKAQRILAEFTRFTNRVVFTHGAVEPLVEDYRATGVAMLPTRRVSEEESRKKADWAGELIIAPPSAAGSPWMRRFGTDADTGFASGWMRVRGIRRRRGYDRGFVISDHADWPGLLRTIEESGAPRVLTTHGYAEPLARHLAGRGLRAAALKTEFGEEDD